MVLSIIGSILGGTYAKNTVINGAGFGMLLTGICFFVLGIFGSLLGILQTQLIKNKPQSGIKPRVLFSSILSVGIGIVLTVIGSIVAGSYAKETTNELYGLWNAANWDSHLKPRHVRNGCNNPKKHLGPKWKPPVTANRELFWEAYGQSASAQC